MEHFRKWQRRAFAQVRHHLQDCEFSDATLFSRSNLVSNITFAERMDAILRMEQ